MKFCALEESSDLKSQLVVSYNRAHAILSLISNLTLIFLFNFFGGRNSKNQTTRNIPRGTGGRKRARRISISGRTYEKRMPTTPIHKSLSNHAVTSRMRSNRFHRRTNLKRTRKSGEREETPLTWPMSWGSKEQAEPPGCHTSTRMLGRILEGRRRRIITIEKTGARFHGYWSYFVVWIRNSSGTA